MLKEAELNQTKLIKTLFRFSFQSGSYLDPWIWNSSRCVYFGWSSL